MVIAISTAIWFGLVWIVIKCAGINRPEQDDDQ